MNEAKGMDIKVKILHIAANAPYNDYWGYQDNLLPKYHKKLGHDVTIITTNAMHKNGEIVETDCADYVLNDGVRVIRLSRINYNLKIVTNLKSKLDIKKYLDEIKPDFIFNHGLVSTTIYSVIEYKKMNPSCVIVQDNHQDYNIGRQIKTWKDKIVCGYYRYINKKSIPYVDRVYGVTPWRKTYAEEYFKIPANKTDVLIMGADDEQIDFENKGTIREYIRKTYKISEEEFLIVTGGKIDTKKKIDKLMRAVEQIEGVKLLIFGTVLDDIKDLFKDILNRTEKIIYVGWIDSAKVYDYFFAADLVFFPGQHSVLWEQACAAKVPCVFERWEGMDHVNNGGNSEFLSPITSDNIKKKIEELLFSEKYYQMKKVAESEATDIYLYSKIAEKSLECKQ